MNSILKIFNASSNSQVKIVGLLCILLTACGGEGTSNPRAIDKNPPQISINTNADTVNFINIGRYDSQHPLLTEYASHELIIQTDINLIVYDDDGLDDKDIPIKGVVIGFRKQASVDGELEVAIIHQIKTIYTDAGATARDALDLDNLVIQNEATQSKVKTSGLNKLDANTEGTYTITYTAEDASGNIGHAHRKVIVGDFVAPVVTLNGSSVNAIPANSIFNDPSATAFDVADNANIEVVRTLARCEKIENDECLNSQPANSVDTSSPATYMATYSATDKSGNVGTAKRTITVLGDFTDFVDVIKDGVIDSLWDKGVFGYDQANNYNASNNPDDNPNIHWEDVNDLDRNYNVLQITHADTDQDAGIFIEASTAVNILGAKEGGILEFDIKVVSGDNKITIKSGCGFPCGGGPRDIGEVSKNGEWETIRYPVSMLEPGGNDGSTGHDFTRVTTGIEIWATARRNTVFRIDNVVWRCLTDCSQEKFDPQPFFTNWVKTDITDGYEAPMEYEGYELVWDDDFDTGTVDTSKWSFDLGNGAEQGNPGWGNSELQYYTPQNATVADGLLSIEANYHHVPLAQVNNKNVPGGASYTSAKLITKNKFDFQYGRVDIRAVVAEGQGFWSAGWMLGATNPLGWPWSGEIDIFDTIGGVGQEDMIVHNMYWNASGPNDPGPDPENPQYSKASLSQTVVNGIPRGQTSLGDEIPEYEQGDTFSNKFHVYSIVWTEDNISFYVNNYKTEDIPLQNDLGDSFTQGDFYLILNVAVGGDWPGNPQLSAPDAVDFTHFPRGMLVDYVRVYQPTVNN